MKIWWFDGSRYLPSQSAQFSQLKDRNMFVNMLHFYGIQSIYEKAEVILMGGNYSYGEVKEIEQNTNFISKSEIDR